MKPEDQIVESVNVKAGENVVKGETGTTDDYKSEIKPVYKAKRLMSLDAFRGFTIFSMLLVNNVALDEATPNQLMHAPWNQGIHFADMVFPWFLLIVGIAIPYSTASYLQKGGTIFGYDLKAFMRMLTLVFLGCFIDSSIYHQPIFNLDVLQLIGLAFFFASLLYGLSKGRRIIIALGMLIVHWAIIRFMPIPGVGTGVFTDSVNAIYHLDRTYLAPYRLQGLISVIPTAALVLIGTTFGDILRRQSKNALPKVIALFGGGTLLALLGWLWSLDIPFNKPVWTASYILFTAGCGIITLGFFYLILDLAAWRWLGFFFAVFGMNAILIYVMPILVKTHVLQEWKWKMADGSLLNVQRALLHYFIEHAGRIAGGWLYTFAYIFFWWLIALYLYKKKVFLRV